MDSPFFFASTRYWSDGDERAHFEWMERIPCVRGVHGKGERLFLSIDEGAVTDQDLAELDALYRRYAGDRSQLQRLHGTKNA